ncbi:hypothetical protein STVIR_7706 [Streptomyces viridochromogenes Tue57]|uniref:Uncharacterized protein n=1 Tax=Streptomyces viridochromogenes Tue57 TaxID=1160705 RepID=L8P7N2_STRVR|nr:hypothetical protein STVIR_7706 [Streptomyces viridochromogenes Tue57]
MASERVIAYWVAELSVERIDTLYQRRIVAGQTSFDPSECTFVVRGGTHVRSPQRPVSHETRSGTHAATGSGRRALSGSPPPPPVSTGYPRPGASKRREVVVRPAPTARHGLLLGGPAKGPLARPEGRDLGLTGFKITTAPCPTRESLLGRTRGPNPMGAPGRQRAAVDTSVLHDDWYATDQRRGVVRSGKHRDRPLNRAGAGAETKLSGITHLRRPTWYTALLVGTAGRFSGAYGARGRACASGNGVRGAVMSGPGDEASPTPAVSGSVVPVQPRQGDRWRDGTRALGPGDSGRPRLRLGQAVPSDAHAERSSPQSPCVARPNAGGDALTTAGWPMGGARRMVRRAGATGHAPTVRGSSGWAGAWFVLALPVRIRVVLRQGGPEPSDGACQDPRYLHLRYADFVGDLLLGPLVVEAQANDATLPLGELLNRRCQRHCVDDQFERPVAGTQQAHQRCAIAVVRRRGIQGTRTALPDCSQRRQDAVRFEPGVLRDLLGRGRTAVKALLKLRRGLEHLTGCFLNRPGKPHRRGPVPDVPLELTDNSGQRVGEERVALSVVVSVHGLDQAERGDLYEIVEVLSAAAEAAGDPPRQRQQLVDGPLPEGCAGRSGRTGRPLPQQRVDAVPRGTLGSSIVVSQGG